MVASVKLLVQAKSTPRHQQIAFNTPYLQQSDLEERRWWSFRYHASEFSSSHSTHMWKTNKRSYEQSWVQLWRGEVID
eukprot:4094527-Amphidinium_carterae.1